MKAALGAVGFTATIGQIVLLREMLAVFYGNELLFGLVFAAWLLWTAAGARALGPLLIRRRPAGVRPLAVGLALAALAFPLQIVLARGARLVLGTTPGAQVEFGGMVAAIAVLVAPLCLLLGALFTLGAQRWSALGGTPGQAYAWESVGGVVGGALFSFLLMYLLNPFQTALLVAVVDFGIGVYLVMAGSLPEGAAGRRVGIARLGDSAKFSAIVFAAAVLFAGVALPAGNALQNATLRWQWPDLLFSADSPYERLTVEARAGQRIFYSDSLLAFETQGTFPEEVAHIPLLMHPNPRRVLLIGGGVAGDLREILKQPVDQVIYVEPDPLLIQTARAYLPPGDAAVLRDPRVVLAQSDGRAFVRASASSHDFGAVDAVILDLPPPDTAALNRFYTVEFLREVRAVLQPGGVLALNLPSAENYWSPELARRNASIYATLRAVFPYVMALPGERNFFLASAGPLERDPAQLTRRLEERRVQTRSITPQYIHYVFTTDRVAQIEAAMANAQGASLNRDLTPICYYYDLALWMSRFYPGFRSAFAQASPAGAWWLLVPLLGFVVVARRRRRLRSDNWAVAGAVGALGMVGMIVETVILLAFQVLHGSVYAQVSAVVTAFMGGLALGSAVGNRVVWAAQESGDRGRSRSWQLVAVLAMAGLASAALPALFGLAVPPPAPAFWALALVAGCLVGAGFPLASELMAGSRGAAAGTLYGADLLGGALGALFGSVFFVPLLGIPLTCAMVAAVALAGVLALV